MDWGESAVFITVLMLHHSRSVWGPSDLAPKQILWNKKPADRVVLEQEVGIAPRRSSMQIRARAVAKLLLLQSQSKF